MKSYKFLITLFAACIVLISCDNEKLTKEEATETPVKLNINLQGAKASPTRSVDGNAVDEDNVINDLIVFVVRNDNAFDVKPLFFSSADLINGTTVPPISATSKAVSVYIVTNTGNLSAGLFKNATDLNGVNAVVASVQGNVNPESQCGSKNVWMAGNNSLQAAGLDTHGVPLRTATVKLGYVPAKIHVIVVNQMSNYSSGNISIDGAAVINGGAWTRFTAINGNFKPDKSQLPAGQPFFYNGIVVDPAHYTDKPAVGDYTVNTINNWAPNSFFPMLPSVSIPATAIPQTNEGFYIFPTITENNTYVTVYGRYKSDGPASSLSTHNYYWSFAFGGVDGLAESIASGQKCIVTITLKGNALTGGGGSPDPTEKPAEATVGITIQTAEWTPVIINKVIE